MWRHSKWPWPSARHFKVTVTFERVTVTSLKWLADGQSHYILNCNNSVIGYFAISRFKIEMRRNIAPKKQNLHNFEMISILGTGYTIRKLFTYFSKRFLATKLQQWWELFYLETPVVVLSPFLLCVFLLLPIILPCWIYDSILDSPWAQTESRL